ncbi:hypothetical protein D3C75_1362120 [compost metagenome]
MFSKFQIVQGVQHWLGISLIEHDTDRLMLIEVEDLPAESEYRTVFDLVDQRMLVDPQPDHFAG